MTTALVLSACGGSVSEPAAKSQKGGIATAATASAAPQRQWATELKFSRKGTVLIDKTIIAVDHPTDGVWGVQAVNRETGKPVWHLDPPRADGAKIHQPLTGPTLSVFAGYTSDGKQVAVVGYTVDKPASGLSGASKDASAAGVDVATGQVLWQRTVPGALVANYDPAKPGAASGAVFISEDDKVEGVDLSTGKTIWTYAGEMQSYALAGTTLVGKSGKMAAPLVALDTVTGAERWRTPLGVKKGLFGDIDWFIQDTTTDSVLAQSRTSGGSGDEYKTLVLDATTGATRKSFDGQVVVTMEEDGPGLYLVGDKGVQGFVGDTTWELPVSNLQAQVILATGGRVWVRGASVVVLDAKTGKEVGQATNVPAFVLPDQVIYLEPLRSEPAGH